MPTMDADGWDRRYSDPAGVWGAEPNMWVTAELDGLASGRALDLGSGEGRHAIWLADRGWQVRAVDFSAIGLEAGRKRAEAAGLSALIEWSVEDVSRIQPESQSVDLVLIAYLQLPEAQLRATVTAAAVALAPGGTFLLVNHDAANLESGTGGPQDPVLLQTPDQVAAWLREAGLNIVTAETRARPVAAAVRPALDCVVRASRSPQNL